MAEPKLKGLMACYDKELTTPEHDELCLSLLESRNDEVVAAIPHGTWIASSKVREIARIKEHKHNWINCRGDKCGGWTAQRVINTKEVVNQYVIGYINVDLEHPVKSGNYLIGVVDALITGKLKIITDFIADYEVGYFSSKPRIFNGEMLDIEEPERIEIVEGGICSADCWTSVKVCVEVKPKIKSFGEVLRQISIYRSYMPETEFVLLAGEVDKKIRQALHTQNVWVVTPNEIISRRDSMGKFMTTEQLEKARAIA